MKRVDAIPPPEKRLAKHLTWLHEIPDSPTHVQCCVCVIIPIYSSILFNSHKTVTQISEMDEIGDECTEVTVTKSRKSRKQDLQENEPNKHQCTYCFEYFKEDKMMPKKGLKQDGFV